MTEQKKKFFNFFDVVVILLIAVVLFVLFRIGVFGNANASTRPESIKEVTYVLRLMPMRFGTENNIHVGDELIETVKKTPIGVVTDIRIEDSFIYVLNQETEEYTKHVIEDEKTVFLTVKADCIVTAGEITVVDGQKILCGSSVPVFGPGYYGGGTFISIEGGAD